MIKFLLLPDSIFSDYISLSHITFLYAFFAYRSLIALALMIRTLLTLSHFLYIVLWKEWGSFLLYALQFIPALFVKMPFFPPLLS